MACCATELLKPCGLITLLRCALVFRDLDNHRHGGEHLDASLEVFGPLLTSLCVAELALFAHGVAGFAAMTLKYITGKFLGAFASSGQAVESRVRRLPRGLSFLYSLFFLTHKERETCEQND